MMLRRAKTLYIYYTGGEGIHYTSHRVHDFGFNSLIKRYTDKSRGIIYYTLQLLYNRIYYRNIES